MNRHTRDFPCPVCGGHADLARGRQIRCAGFSLDLVAFCTRDELAGSLPLHVSTSPPSYQHLLRARCGCGMLHGAELPSGDPAPFYPRTTLHIDVRHAIFSALIDRLPLRDEAILDLTSRGLPLWAAEKHGFRSLPRRGGEQTKIRDSLAREFGEDVLRRCPGLHDKNGRMGIVTTATGDGYFVPFRDEEGRITGLQIKYVGGKYKSPFGSVLSEVYCIAGPVKPGCALWLTEGGTKAIVSAHLRPDLVFFGVAGQSLQSSHVQVIQRIEPSRVVVALDRECNAGTVAARRRWLDRLQAETTLPIYDAIWEGAA